jgi:hypothetical protein
LLEPFVEAGWVVLDEAGAVRELRIPRSVRQALTDWPLPQAGPERVIRGEPATQLGERLRGVQQAAEDRVPLRSRQGDGVQLTLDALLDREGGGDRGRVPVAVQGGDEPAGVVGGDGAAVQVQHAPEDKREAVPNRVENLLASASASARASDLDHAVIEIGPLFTGRRGEPVDAPGEIRGAR